MTKILIALLLPLVTFGLWTQATKFSSQSQVIDLPSRFHWLPPLILMIGAGGFLWEKSRIRWERRSRLLAPMGIALIFWSLGVMAYSLRMMAQGAPAGSSLGQWLLPVLLPCLIYFLLYLSTAFSIETESRRPESSAEPESFSFRKELWPSVQDYLSFSQESLGAEELGLYHITEKSGLALAPDAKEPLPAAVAALIRMPWSQRSFVEGLGTIPLRKDTGGISLLLPSNQALRLELYARWAPEFSWSEAKAIQLSHCSQALGSLVQSLTDPSSKRVPLLQSLVHNAVLTLLVLPIGIFFVLAALGYVHLVPWIIPWSHAGIPTALGFLAYYFIVLFAWNTAERRSSTAWTWHKSQEPKARPGIWISKLRSLRWLAWIISLTCVMNTFHHADSPKSFGPDLEVGFIALFYLHYAQLCLLPARTFGSLKPNYLPKSSGFAQGEALWLMRCCYGTACLLALWLCFSQKEWLRQTFDSSLLCFSLVLGVSWCAAMLSHVPFRHFVALLGGGKDGHTSPAMLSSLRPFFTYVLLGFFGFACQYLACLANLTDSMQPQLFFTDTLPILVWIWTFWGLCLVAPFMIRLHTLQPTPAGD